MKFEAGSLRNFAVAGGGSCGKTSLCDLMLFKAKAVERLGSVDAKSSVSDFTPEEQERRASIHAAHLCCEWKGKRLIFTDTPGYGEFCGELTGPFAASDAVLIVVDGSSGLDSGALRAWKMAKEAKLPHAVLVNRLDKESSGFHAVVDQLHEAFGNSVCVPVTIAHGSAGSFDGVFSILGKPDAPPELQAFASECKEALMDAIAGSDDALIEKYLDGKPLSDEELLGGLRKAVLSGSLAPVFAGSVAKDIGIAELMDGLAALFPNPLERQPFMDFEGGSVAPSLQGDPQAFVFRSVADPFIGQLSFLRVVSGRLKPDSELCNLTNGSKERFGQLLSLNGKAQAPLEEACPGVICAVVKLKSTKTGDSLGVPGKAKALAPLRFPHPVMALAVSAAKSGEEDKLMAALGRLADSDPSIKVERDPETHETILRGMGDQHLNLALKKLKELSKAEILSAAPKIPYRETVLGHGEGHCRHKKQTGGHGQFAEVFLKIDANPAGYEFVNAVVGGSIPKNFIPAVEKGVLEAMERGPLAGCRVQSVKVTVYDGKSHDVDSSEMAFKLAARMAFRDAMAKAKPVLLEPVMKAAISVPERFMGDATGLLPHKRGRILGMEASEGLETLLAEIPLAETSKLASELRAMTQGSGSCEMEFARYDAVPPNLAAPVIAARSHAVPKEED